MSKYPPIHITPLEKFQKCKRLHYYSNRDWGLGYHNSFDNKWIAWGNWGHYCTALWWAGIEMETALTLTKNRLDELGGDKFDQWSDFEGLMRAYNVWNQKDEGRYSRRNLMPVTLPNGEPTIELTFDVDYKGFRFQGQIDGPIIEHTPTGELYIIERKFTSRPEDKIVGLKWSQQVRFYPAIIQTYYDMEIVGTLLEVNRICNPYSVKQLKRGGLSKAKRELDGTTYDVYVDLLLKDQPAKDHKQILADYQDELNYLKHYKLPIFRRRPFKVTDLMKVNSLETTYKEALEMVKAREQGEFVSPSYSDRGCLGCPFRKPCLVHDRGGDWRRMLDVHYEQYSKGDRFDDTLQKDIVRHKKGRLGLSQ